MITAFTAYIKTIAAFLIFSVFAEMIMPENKFKKYVNMVLGILMIVTILNPVLNIISGEDLDFSASVTKKENMLFNKIDAGTYEAEQNKLVLEIYLEELNARITEDLKAEGIEVLYVAVEVDENVDSPNYGNIESVHVTAALYDGGESLVTEVEPVKGYFDKEEYEEDGAESLKTEIADVLYKRYNISSDMVTVEI